MKVTHEEKQEDGTCGEETNAGGSWKGAPELDVGGDPPACFTSSLLAFRDAAHA